MLRVSCWVQRKRDSAGITAGGLDSGPPLAGLPGMALVVCCRGSPGDSAGSSCILLSHRLAKGSRMAFRPAAEMLEQKLKEETPPCTAAITVWQAMRSPTIVWMATLTFLAYIGQYTFVFWLPTMLKRLTGFTDMRVGMVGALPFLAAFVTCRSMAGTPTSKRSEGGMLQ